MQTSLRRKPLLQRAARAAPEPLRVAPAQACSTVVVCRPGKARGRPFAQGGDHRQYQARSGTVPPPSPSAAGKTAVSVLQLGFESEEGVPPLTAAERRQPVDGRLTRLIQLEREKLLASGKEGEEVQIALASTFDLALTTVKNVLKRGRGEREGENGEGDEHPRKRAEPGRYAAVLRGGRLHLRVARKVPGPQRRPFRTLGVPLLRSRARQRVHAAVANGPPERQARQGA